MAARSMLSRGASPQPKWMKRKFVNNNGSAIKSRMLKTSANAIEPAAVAVALDDSYFDGFSTTCPRDATGDSIA